MEITPEQIRAARALLRLDQAELAERAHTSQSMISWVEALEDAGPAASPTLLNDVKRVLEDAGVEFIPRGVRKRPALTADQQALYEKLRAISLQSAAELNVNDMLTDDDLYDENGLPT